MHTHKKIKLVECGWKTIFKRHQMIKAGCLRKQSLWWREIWLVFSSCASGQTAICILPKLCIPVLHSNISHQHNHQTASGQARARGRGSGVEVRESVLKRVGVEFKFEEQEVLSKMENLASHLWQCRHGDELLCAHSRWVCLCLNPQKKDENLRVHKEVPFST